MIVELAGIAIEVIVVVGLYKLYQFINNNLIKGHRYAKPFKSAYLLSQILDCCCRNLSIEVKYNPNTVSLVVDYAFISYANKYRIELIKERIQNNKYLTVTKEQLQNFKEEITVFQQKLKYDILDANNIEKWEALNHVLNIFLIHIETTLIKQNTGFPQSIKSPLSIDTDKIRGLIEILKNIDNSNASFNMELIMLYDIAYWKGNLKPLSFLKAWIYGQNFYKKKS